MNSGRPMDYYNLPLDKSVSAFDRTHWVKIGAGYDLPLGRGCKFGDEMNRLLDTVVGGWTIQYIRNYSSGEPFGLGGTGTPNSNFATKRAVIQNPLGQFLVLSSFDASRFDMSQINTTGATVNCYIDTSLVRDPGRYERGNAPFRLSQLRGFGFYNEDFSLRKNFRPVESMRIQFRAEGFNLFNRHRFSDINTNPASPLLGQITGVSGDRRQIQFGIWTDF